MVLMAFRGPPPAGHIAAHNNGDRSDARLVNLRWATHVENAADKKLHGTAVQGSSHWAAKLTEQQVIDIRERLAAGEKCVPLGKEYGVAFTAIQRIGSGEIWAHIGGPRTRRFRDRLTADQVRQIRRLAEKSSRREIARRFGVPYTTVGRIVSGVSYATVR